MSISTKTLVSVADLFTQPKSAFDALRPNQAWGWVALILVLAVHLGVVFHYFTWVDADWFVDYIVELSATEQMSEQQIKNIREFTNFNSIFYASLIEVVVLTATFTVTMGGYLFFVALADEDNQVTLRQWLAFSCWLLLPEIVESLSVYIGTLFAEGNQVPYLGLNALSFNSLLFNLPETNLWHGLVSTLSLVTLWKGALIWIGLQRWTTFDSAKSARLAVIPFVTVYGVWAILNLVL